MAVVFAIQRFDNQAGEMISYGDWGSLWAPFLFWPRMRCVSGGTGDTRGYSMAGAKIPLGLF
jgi:hypothetical protein